MLEGGRGDSASKESIVQHREREGRSGGGGGGIKFVCE